jgi:hypothetical protein
VATVKTRRQKKLAQQFEDLARRREQEIEKARQYRAAHPVPPPMKPATYLAHHPVTLHLKSLGVTAAQLKATAFRSHDGNFRDWPFTSAKTWPPALFDEMHVWTALKWLILDDPPESQHRLDAWELVATYIARQTFDAGRAQQHILANGRQKANERRLGRADDLALSLFRSWQTNVRAALRVNGQPMSASERVERYFAAKEPPRRQRARIRKLLQEQKIPPL